MIIYILLASVTLVQWETIGLMMDSYILDWTELIYNLADKFLNMSSIRVQQKLYLIAK